MYIKTQFEALRKSFWFFFQKERNLFIFYTFNSELPGRFLSLKKISAKKTEK